MIAIRGLQKSFGSARVLRGIDLDIADGEVVALIGRSGCGKTTLLRCVNFLEEYDAGEIRLDDEELWYRTAPDGVRRRVSEAEARRMRQQMGIVFQQYNLFPALTAEENVEYALNVKGTRGRAAETEARRVLDRVGLGDRLRFLPRDLSGGQKQRVAIARALAGAPRVLLADEPTANLDTAVGTQILELFRDLAKSERKGLVIVTHDPKVREIADRVVGIRDGRLAA